MMMTTKKVKLEVPEPVRTFAEPDEFKVSSITDKNRHEVFGANFKRPAKPAPKIEAVWHYRTGNGFCPTLPKLTSLPAPSPLYTDQCGLYYWFDEVQQDACGPYETKSAAIADLGKYVNLVLK
jgi:hypothetical protein